MFSASALCPTNTKIQIFDDPMEVAMIPSIRKKKKKRKKKKEKRANIFCFPLMSLPSYLSLSISMETFKMRYGNQNKILISPLFLVIVIMIFRISFQD